MLLSLVSVPKNIGDMFSNGHTHRLRTTALWKLQTAVGTCLERKGVLRVRGSDSLVLGQRLKEALWKSCVNVASGIVV